jgi:hypothetical protein
MYILESVVLTHEIIHEAVNNIDKVIVLKLDYKKHIIELISIFMKRC